MRGLNILSAFLGGAIVGAGAALLFAPEKGEDLRGQIKHLLKKYGVCKCTKGEELDTIVDEIAAEIWKHDACQGLPRVYGQSLNSNYLYMKANGKIPQTIHTLADLTKRLVSLYVENVKFTAAEKLTVVMSAGVLLVVAVVLGIFALAFLSGA